ncbi:hypothetical protein [Dokdonella soli]|uniref:Uncharacterized protein n=1 Tax=Dokdonella soli TaxID=529810 RepID=A0ABN1IV37_9GAMM
MAAYLATPTFGTGNYANGWLWYQSSAANGSNAQDIDPGKIDPNSSGSWTNNNNPGMAMHIEQVAACGAPWMTTTPVTLTLKGLLSGSVTVTVDSTQFPAGQNKAAALLCIDSNNAAHPVCAVPVTATQN